MNKISGFVFLTALIGLMLFAVVTFTEQQPQEVVPQSLYGIATNAEESPGDLKEASSISLTKAVEEQYLFSSNKVYGINIGLPTGEYTMECVYPHNAFKSTFVSLSKGWFGLTTYRALPITEMEAYEGDKPVMDYVKAKVRNGNRLNLRVPIGTKNEINCVLGNKPFNIKFTPAFQVTEMSTTNFPGIICPQETVTLCTQIIDASTSQPLMVKDWELLTYFQGDMIAEFKYSDSLNPTCIEDVPYGFGGYKFYLSQPILVDGEPEQVIRQQFEYVPELCSDKIMVTLPYERK